MRQPPGPDDPTTVGRFRVVGLLGSGGMGRVLLGEDADGRLAAIKLVHAELADGDAADGFRARFRREIRLAAQAPPGWTAPFLDADPDAPRPWLATAFLDAPSLLEQLTAHGFYDPLAAARLGAGLAAALSALHSAGLVHRDLKPSNVLLTDGGPRLIDFGISRAVDATGITATGQSVGTPEYMSPEQVLGADAEPPSDVFSLGSLLTFAVVGRTPFHAGSPTGALYRVVHSEPHLPTTLGPLLPVLHACLAKDPGARPTAPEVRDRLATLAAGDGGTRALVTPSGRAPDGRTPGGRAPGGQAPGAAAPGGQAPGAAAPGGPGSLWPGPRADGPTARIGTGTGGPSGADGLGWSGGAGAAGPGGAGGPGGPGGWSVPGPSTRVAPPPAPEPSNGGRRRLLLVAGAVLLAVLVGVGATAGVLALRPDPTAPVAAGTTTNPFVPPSSGPASAAPSADITAGASVVDTAQDVRYGSASDQLRFASPSRNIACLLGPSEVRCDVVERTWQVPPRPSSCPLAYGTGAELAGSAAAALTCAGDTVADPTLPALDYGRALRTRDVTCVSREGGVECRNPSTGHGFTVSRGAYRLY